MKQMYVKQTTKKIQEPEDVRRLTKEGQGIWEVQSSRHPQLWYKVVLDMDTDQIHCGCKGWKFGRGQLCRHMFRVMEVET